MSYQMLYTHSGSHLLSVPAWGKSTGVSQHQENYMLPLLLCVFSVVWSH